MTVQHDRESLEAPNTTRRDIAAAMAGLTLMAVVQPLFDLLGKNAGFLTAHALSGSRLLAFAIGLGAVLPLLLATIYLVLDRMSVPLGRWAAALARLYAVLLIFPLATSLFSQISRRLLDSTSAIVGISVILGIILTWLVLQRAGIRQFVGLLSLGLIAFPVIFLLNGNIAPLLSRESGFDPELKTDIEKRPVVFVIFDELPLSTLMTQDQNLDSARFPNFHRLAETSTWFRRALSAADSTAISTPALVTARRPSDALEPVFTSYPKNLFSWLGASGYEMFAIQNHTRLCPKGACREIVPPLPLREQLRLLGLDLGVLYLHLIAPDEWSTRLPAVDQNWKGFWTSTDRSSSAVGSSVPLTINAFLETIEAGHQNRLYYLHPNLPHVPWKFLASGKEYGPVGQPVRPHGLLGEVWGNDEWATVQGYQRHLLQTQFADTVLGRLMDRLQELQIWDESIVIVTADHGCAFWPGEPRRAFGDANLEDILEVPLFIKLPEQQDGLVDDRPVQTLDIVPTIADVLGTQTPWQTEGMTLLGEVRPNRERRVAVEAWRAPDGLPVITDDARRQKTLERKHRLFGSGTDSLFAIGEYSDLIGSSTESLVEADSPLEDSRLRYELFDRWAFEDVDLNTGFLPTRICGSLRGQVPPRVDTSSERDSGASLPWLAVSIDGVVRAVTRAFVDLEDRLWFAAMVDEQGFRQGENEVEVFAIGSNPSALNKGQDRVHLVTMEAERPYQIAMVGDGPIVRGLALSSDELLPVVPEAVSGEMFVLDDRIGGWAAKVWTPQQDYHELFLFRGDRLLYRGPADRRLNDRYPIPTSGFRLELSRETTRSPDELRLFARVGDLASELSRPGSAPTALPLLAPATAFRDDRGKRRLRTQGNILRITPRVFVGNVHKIEVRDDKLLLEAWASQREARLPAVSFVVLIDREAIEGTYEVLELPGIARDFGISEAGSLGYGVRVMIPLSLLLESNRARMRLFALSNDGRLGELQTNGRPVAPVVRHVVTDSGRR